MVKTKNKQKQNKTKKKPTNKLRGNRKSESTKEFRGMIVNMMQNSGNKMEAPINRIKEHIEKIQRMFNKDLEEKKNRQSAVNHTITKKKHVRENP